MNYLNHLRLMHLKYQFKNLPASVSICTILFVEYASFVAVVDWSDELFQPYEKKLQ